MAAGRSPDLWLLVVSFLLYSMEELSLDSNQVALAFGDERSMTKSSYSLGATPVM